MASKKNPKEIIPTLETDGCIVLEKELPLPLVHYPSRWGAFLGFQAGIKSPVYHCSCQQKGMEVYLLKAEHERFQGIPKASRILIGSNSMENLQFMDCICHICNQIPPSYGYGKKGVHSTKFYSIYGYYVEGLAYEYGLDRYGRVWLPERIPSELASFLVTQTWNDKMLDEPSLKIFTRYCEDVMRGRMGHFLIGKKWRTEMELLGLVKKVFPNYTVIHQYELDHLKADIYIEELKLVIEYQGEQHFHPIESMGGEEGWKKTQERDRQKSELCHYYNLSLVYFSYQDKLTEELVKRRIMHSFKK